MAGYQCTRASLALLLSGGNEEFRRDRLVAVGARERARDVGLGEAHGREPHLALVLGLGGDGGAGLRGLSGRAAVLAGPHRGERVVHLVVHDDLAEVFLLAVVVLVLFRVGERAHGVELFDHGLHEQLRRRVGVAGARVESALRLVSREAHGHQHLHSRRVVDAGARRAFGGWGHRAVDEHVHGHLDVAVGLAQRLLGLGAVKAHCAKLVHGFCLFAPLDGGSLVLERSLVGTPPMRAPGARGISGF
mmetsp:Transcript_34226/g.107904  ORF Transcript_34226/g.107904 Transcript_34226/m.107904 type:complete len:247 (+) Transcript_34226:160-900(+)